MTELLTLEDTHIHQILRDPRYASMGCVQNLKAGLQAAVASCGRCKGKRAAAKDAAMRSFRACLTTLPQAQRDAFKKLLGTKKVRLTKRNSKGAKVIVTF
jgi:uncharacterized UBP type Zn finger protein